ncbi:MAG: DUF86 domain-containing protein [Burkholderiaceae bacterium]|nr:DUF86 domain-containing protein [Burkholderiaceae bacterium]
MYLDDLIASAERIGRLTVGRSIEQFVADEAAFDAVLFNLQVIGEAIKKLPAEAQALLPQADRRGPARLRDLIAHHYFALDTDIVWEVANRHVPALLKHALVLRGADAGPSAG